MRNQLYVNYWPVTGLGARILAESKPPEPEWRPGTIKGTQVRTMPDGRLQTRDVEYEELHAPDGQKPKKTEQYKEPAYPWPGETVGLVAPVIAQKDPVLAKLEALDERMAGDMDMYRRLVDHRGGCSCHTSPPCNACSQPLNAHEAEELGWLDDDVADEWQSTNPAIAGWYESNCAKDLGGGRRVRYWDGRVWSSFCWPRESVETKKRDMARPTSRVGIQWRGPRLIGDAWPEPEAPKAASFTITIKAGGGASAGSSGGAVAHGVGGACSGAVAHVIGETAYPGTDACIDAMANSGARSLRSDWSIDAINVLRAYGVKEGGPITDIPPHRRAAFIQAINAIK